MWGAVRSEPVVMSHAAPFLQQTGGPDLNTCIMNNTYGLLTVGTTQVRLPLSSMFVSHST